jgi:hypothetical protein
MDRRLFFLYAFLHRKSTALAAMRSEYRLIPQKRADEKRHAVLRFGEKPGQFSAEINALT